MKRLELDGIVISTGYVSGNLHFMENSISSDTHASEEIDKNNIDNEILKFHYALESAKYDLEETVHHLRTDGYKDEAEIVKTHILMLNDVGFKTRVENKIRKQTKSAFFAIHEELNIVAERFSQANNEMFSERIADIRDITQLLRKKLHNTTQDEEYEIPTDIENPILVIDELLPSLILKVRKTNVAGIVVYKGTGFSHGAILSKAFGIPVLKLDQGALVHVSEKTPAYINAVAGYLVLHPADEEKQIAASKEEIQFDKNDLPLSLWVNIVDPDQICDNDFGHVSGIGLYRTEILFMQEEDFPSEEKQMETYSMLFERCDWPVVTIRTLDIGGDKPLPYFSVGPQDNPYLGLRAHRIYHFHPEIFVNQVRAILRAGKDCTHLRIMFPMIESVDELAFVKGLMDEAINSLRLENIEFNEDYETGVLIEVPSAVWDFQNIIQNIDFVSIGTNDLFQYFFAVDRNNANAYQAYQPEHPVSLRMLKWMIDIAESRKIPISVCGEIASDVAFLPILVGLGLQNISVDYHSLTAISEYLISIDRQECRSLFIKCLNSSNAEEVHNLVKNFNQKSIGYSYERKHSGHAVDPICKMSVETEGNELTVEKNGKRYFFCSKHCMKKFLTDSMISG